MTFRWIAHNKITALRRGLGTLFILCSSHYAIADNSEPSSYLCIGDKGSGFSFNSSSQTWEHARFNVSNSKYLLSKNQGVWTWKKVGEKDGISCSSGFNSSGYMHCEMLQTVTMNKKNLRYMLVYPVGYVNAGIGGKEGDDTPSIEIGKCSPL